MKILNKVSCSTISIFQSICPPLKNISNGTKKHCNQGEKTKGGTYKKYI
jgi:hypothetical protein